jgi:hypothetical protein
MGDVADVCRIADAVLARSGSIDVLIHGARGMPPAGARARARESTAASPKTSSARSSSRASSKGCAPQKRDARAAESEPHKCSATNHLRTSVQCLGRLRELRLALCAPAFTRRPVPCTMGARARRRRMRRGLSPIEPIG